MSEFKALNGHIHNRNKGMISCGECGRVLAELGDNLKGFSLSFSCKCGSLCKVDYFKTRRKDEEHRAILETGRVVCPCCGNVVFNLFPENIRNFTIRAVCKCGGKLYGIKEHSYAAERIKEYI